MLRWLCLALPLAGFFACQGDENVPAPGDTGFDSATYCSANPKANGCCYEEATHVIDFEDVANETLVPLANRYGRKGVEFMSGSNGPYVVTEKFNGNQIGNAAVSGENALLIGFNNVPVRVVFVNPDGGGKGTTNHVSGTVGDKSDETDMIILKAYDFHGNQIAADTFVSQPSGKAGDHDFGEVSVDTAGIYYVTFEDTSTSGANLDDFTYGCIRYRLR